jgi:tetratricopeptide (TPR) repeat protein
MSSALKDIQERLAGITSSIQDKPPVPSSAKAEPTEVKRDERFEIPSVKESPPFKEKRIPAKPVIIALIVVLAISTIVIGILVSRKGDTVSDLKDIGNVTPTHIPPPKPTPTIKETPLINAEYYYSEAMKLKEARGDANEIQNNLMKALDLDPEHYGALREYGFFLFQREDYLRAGGYLRKAMERCENEKDRREIQRRLALIHEKTSR